MDLAAAAYCSDFWFFENFQLTILISIKLKMNQDELLFRWTIGLAIQRIIWEQFKSISKMSYVWFDTNLLYILNDDN